ncbi:MAG: cation:proton antiporter [Sandaracinus sp.]|nr:cation:proton antiporter [Sandaracinus sp.]
MVAPASTSTDEGDDPDEEESDGEHDAGVREDGAHGDGGHGDGGHGDGGHGDGGHGHGNAEGATLVQFGIVVLLVGMMWLLHRFGGPSSDVDYDPTAMLALGFVVLASYTIGALVDVIRLPHITGYLLAGLVFGSSIAHTLGLSRLWAPFDEGVVHEGVIRQLKPLETLAVALIAISAGGELKLDTLRTGLKPILGVLGGQLLAVLAVVTGFIYLVSGPIDWLVLPGLGPLGPDAVIPIGLTVAAVSFATSPSATLAVINETGARGPMSRTVLSSVVLKDVFVVVLFGVFSAWALQALGNAGEGSLAKQLAIEIFGSIALGIALGAAVAVYLRFVGRELMLFVLGVVYTGTLVATEAHLDGVIVFLTAGFVVSNFSRQGENLLHTVEALSMPTYVVFFTLAGAKLHLDEVFGPIGAFGVALVLLRVGAIYLGTRFGGAIGGAKGTTQRYGWMGFVSQAGVAITLAGIVKQRFGEAGEALSSLIIAGVAINEVAGPVMLKTALGLAGETRKAGAKKKAEEAERPSRPRESELDRPSFHPWPDEASKVDWGERIKTGAPRLDRALRELEIDLRTIVREVGDGPMIAFREDAERYLRELRREFLRHHRRLVVKAREIDPSATDDAAVASRQALALALRTEQTELSERWRSVVLARSAALAKGGGWTPQGIAETLDDVVAALPERVEVPWDPRIFETKPGDKLPLRTRRSLLRARRRVAKLFGKEMAPRSAELRELARYHLEYRTPPRLEGVAALFVSAEQHLAGRTRHLFDGIVAACDALALDVADLEVDPNARLERLRQDLEQDLMLALDEVSRIARDGTARTARVLAQGLRDVRDEATLYGSIELPTSSRKASRAFQERLAALEALGEAVQKLRKSSAGEYSLLAMELELVGLEGRVKDVLATRTTRLEGEMQRRALAQAERVKTALEEASRQLDETLASSLRGDAMAASIREVTAATEKTAGDAARIVRELRDELLDEQKVAPLLDALGEATGQLTSRYEVVAGRLQRGEYKLPPAVERVDVPFREVVAEHVDTRVSPLLFRATREFAERLQPLAAALREVERLVAFNVELATSELEVLPEEDVPVETRRLLHEMVGGQLERSLGVVTGVHDEAARWPGQLGEAVREAVLGALDELRGQLVDGKITRAKLDEMRRSASRRRLAQRAGQLPQVLREARIQITRGFVALVGEARLEQWRRRLGLPAPRTSSEVESVAFASPSPHTELPLVYRRLFAADTMEAGDVLTGREDAIARSRAVLESKRAKGVLRSVVLVGLDGVGKASVSNAIVRGGRWRQVRRITLDKPMDVAAVEALLKETNDAQLVVLDGLCWMVSAEPGGFAPLRRFVDGVVADGGKRAWLVHAEELFWRWGKAIAPLQEAFPETVALDPLTPDELTAAVMERHRLSGYGHAFDRLEGTSAVEGLLARSASRIRRPYELYFAELHTATGGLVRDALRLWLASIKNIEGEVVRVGPVPASPYTALGRLPESELIALFWVARQGWMRAESFAWLLRVDPTEARARLAKLSHLGLLEEKDGTFRVALHLRGALGLVVRDRGWM